MRETAEGGPPSAVLCYNSFWSSPQSFFTRAYSSRVAVPCYRAFR